ncbi:interferon alpha-inducible protein 27-like protein 2 [Perca flavescens]|uniref:interferon alpha-inducible protein 27-like protein 2 n=1 Tax=Perca flavescens TaxID=8167 RepID=UPI00106EB335|nr:interferon alpha-inducible protein 27-like protein 2 [Perca flavescens]
MGLLTAVFIATGTAIAAPVVLGVVGALGFTSAGIAVSSYAASMMPVANGGAVAAGSAVAVLHAAGAAATGAGAAVGWLAAIII